MKVQLIALAILWVTTSSLAQNVVPVAPGYVPNAKVQAGLAELTKPKPTGISSLLPDKLFGGNTGPQLPTSIADLPCEEVKIKLLTKDIAVQAGFLSASAKFESFDYVLVESWEKYAPLTINGQRVRYGMSMQMVVKIKGVGVEVDLGHLIRSLSLGGSFRKVDAMIEMYLNGFSSPDITEALPSATLLSSKDNLRELSGAFGEVKKKVWSTESEKATGFRPQIIAVELDSPASIQPPASSNH